MANSVLSRTQIVALKEETTEGTLEALTAGSEFVKIREGASLSSENEVIDSDELVGSDIGKSKPIVVGENPSATLPMYANHSGVVGQEPEEGIAYESCFGDKSVAAAEYNTVSSSTVSLIKVDTGEGASFEEGEALLIQDGTNGYAIRNINSISSDDLTLAFNLSNAPAAGVELGKAVLYKPGISHPTFSAYRFSSETSTAYNDAIAGNRTTSLTFTFPARDLATVDIEAEGIKYFFDFFTIDATNDDFSIVDDGGTVTGSLTQKVYRTPIELADEIATKLTAASVGSGDDTITCVYSSTNGKFTIASDGSTLELGCNVANSVFADIGFGVLALTAATTYTAATAISFASPYSPSFDSADPNVSVKNELLIGDNTDIVCRKPTNTTLTIGTPKTQVKSACAENGVYENLTLERTAVLSTTILLSAYEAELYDKSINNTTTKVCYNWGVKDNSGNWTPGKCCNLFMQSATINSIGNEDQDGYRVINLEITGFVTDSTKDVFLNFI